MSRGNKKFLWIAPLGLVGVLGLIFLLTAFGLFNLKFWGPKFQEADREIFEETQSFVHGKISHLNRLRLEYETADTDTRRASYRTMILQEASVLEEDALPASLKLFIDSLKVRVP